MANTLTQVGIETGNIVEAYHVTQSIDAFTGAEAYDITLSGSFNMTGPINGQPGLVNPLTASYAMNTLSASYALSSSYALSASYALSSSYALSASYALSSSYALSASYAPNFANTNLTQSENRIYSTAGNTLNITDGTNDRLEILLNSTVFNDSGADIDFRVESSNNTNALLVDASTDQVRIGVTGSKSAPSLYFGSDSNTGFYNSGSNDILYITAGGNNVARIAPLQLIVGDETFVSNTNYSQAGVLTQGGLYSLGGFSCNLFYSPSGYFARGKANLGGFSIEYLPTSSLIPAADGEKVCFRTMPSGSSVGVEVSQSTALRMDVNYLNAGVYEPNIEIVNRLTLGKTWFADGSGTELQRNGSGQVGVASSDKRLKTNIQTLTGSLNIVKALNGVKYNWTNENDPSFVINNTGTQIGLIAQEVEQIIPEVVKPNGVKDYKTVDYDKIVAVLIEAIKEQQQQIDNLQQQIDNLK